MVNFAFDPPFWHSARAPHEQYIVDFPGIDAGTYGPEVDIHIDERELWDLSPRQMEELEWILQHPKTGQEATAFRSTGFEEKTLIRVRSVTPCITTLPERDNHE